MSVRFSATGPAEGLELGLRRDVSDLGRAMHLLVAAISTQQQTLDAILTAVRAPAQDDPLAQALDRLAAAVAGQAAETRRAVETLDRLQRELPGIILSASEQHAKQLVADLEKREPSNGDATRRS